MTRVPSKRARDRGVVLPIVLVVAVVLSVVLLALARYATSDLRYSNVTENRAERQATATSAITYGVERIRLGRAECASDSFGSVTAGLLNRNGTTTALSCTRVSSTTTGVGGFALVLTGNGITGNFLTTQGGGSKPIYGPVYTSRVDGSPVAINGGGVTEYDGDLWYYKSTCAAATAPSGWTFNPSATRGLICTSETWLDVAPRPVVPNLNALPARNWTDFTMSGACRVYQPGHYSGAPDLGGDDVYFMSGDYWFDNTTGTIDTKQQTVWFGHPGSTTPALANAACTGAAASDPRTGGAGAVAYMGRGARFVANTQTAIEFFPRLVGNVQLSIQQLEASSGYPASTVTAASGTALFDLGTGTTPDTMIRGLVYAPDGYIEFDNSSNSAQQQLLGGAVVAKIHLQTSASASGFRISVPTTPTLTKYVLTATSTTSDGVSTTVQAIVDYRPDIVSLTNRVAINSLRVVS